MITIFLDFDGVLHPMHQAKESLFQGLPLFESIVLNYSPQELQVVVSSSWGRVYPFEEIKALFSPRVQPYVIDITPQFFETENLPSELWSFLRHGECWMWMHQNMPPESPWLAIDDDPRYFLPDFPQLLLTDPDLGLTKNDARTLAALIDSARAGCIGAKLL